MNCEDCQGEIKNGSFIRWNSLLWHFHCFLHRMSCTTYQNMLQGFKTTKCGIYDLEEHDRALLLTWRDIVAVQTEDLINLAIDRETMLRRQQSKISPGEAFNQLRNLCSIEIRKQAQLLREYRQAASVLLDSSDVEEILVYGGWLYAHSTPLYYLDRGI